MKRLSDKAVSYTLALLYGAAFWWILILWWTS